MNIALNKIETKPGVCVESQVVGLTSPEFQTYAQEVIKMIAKMTKNSLKAIGAGLAVTFRYLERKWNEGADCHNRMQAIHDERYARNFYHIRSVM